MLGSRTYVSETQRYLALACLVSDPSAAVSWAEQAVATAREVRATDQEGVALQVLGKAHVARGEMQLAIDALEQSRENLRGTTERQELARRSPLWRTRICRSPRVTRAARPALAHR